MHSCRAEVNNPPRAILAKAVSSVLVLDPKSVVTAWHADAVEVSGQTLVIQVHVDPNSELSTVQRNKMIFLTLLPGNRKNIL